MQQYHGLARDIQSHPAMCSAIHRIDADTAPRHKHIVVHLAQSKTSFQQAAKTGVDTVFRNQPSFYRLIQMGIFHATFQIRPVDDG